MKDEFKDAFACGASLAIALLIMLGGVAICTMLYKALT